MFYKSVSIFFFSFFSLALFGHNIQKEKVLLENLNAVHKVVVFAPEAIKDYKNGKLYLNEDRFSQTNSGSSLSLYNGEILSLSFMSSDSIGPYLITMGAVGVNEKKAFKNVCNVCDYEWSGNVWDIWCPNCGSTDWKTIRDRG